VEGFAGISYILVARRMLSWILNHSWCYTGTWYGSNW